jgi:hypothetical protein
MMIVIGMILIAEGGVDTAGWRFIVWSSTFQSRVFPAPADFNSWSLEFE